MIRIGHIINPVRVKEHSDLYKAQPITFETMRIAHRYTKGKVDVKLFTAQYPEDRDFVPEGFIATRDLVHSILDLGEFEIPRKLPIIKDILDRLYEVSDADYFIYTNVDIALLPHFYLAVNALIEKGYDALIINRRVIPNAFCNMKELPLMWAEVGQEHCGYDCFVFRRDVYRYYDLGLACLGANRIGRVMYANLRFNATNFKEIKTAHVTFHLGNDQSWRTPKYHDYDLHNEKELLKILERMKAKQSKTNKQLWLQEFYKDSQERINILTTDSTMNNRHDGEKTILNRLKRQFVKIVRY